MNETTRVPLTINSEGERGLGLGPLTVEVIREGGEATEFVLSSGYRQHELEVAPGRYAVIARRPNGTRLRQSVMVTEGSPATVSLADTVPVSPNEFMLAETMLGDVAPGRSLAMRGLGTTGLVKGFAGASIGALASPRLATAPGDAPAIGRRMNLRIWDVDARRRAAPVVRRGASFLKIHFSQPRLGWAVGLLDEDGFGPIVMVPPFAQPLEITFLAEGVATKAAARYLNPSGQRAPVALATPAEPVLVDLLTALGSPVVEHAGAIWDQNLGSPQQAGSDQAKQALENLSDKFERPAEALLGAHYLLRFLPDRLPLAWADNLARALPDASDGPVIAAWLRLLSGAEDVKRLTPEAIDREVGERLALAASRPRTLFSRTRRLLAEGLRLGSESPPKPSAPDKDMPPPSAFLNYGAHSGGLEAFWGLDPYNPGPKSSRSTLPGRHLASVMLHDSIFTAASDVVGGGRRSDATKAAADKDTAPIGRKHAAKKARAKKKAGAKKKASAKQKASVRKRTKKRTSARRRSKR